MFHYYDSSLLTLTTTLNIINVITLSGNIKHIFSVCSFFPMFSPIFYCDSYKIVFFYIKITVVQMKIYALDIPLFPIEQNYFLME